MWTIDVIEALQAIQQEVGHCICFESISQIPYATKIVVQVAPDARYIYDYSSKKFVEKP